MTLLRLTPATATHRGMRRRHNEDAVGYEYPADINTLQSYGALFIVADGVGGLSSGDKASQMTVQHLIKHYYAGDVSISSEERLVQAIQKVNTDVFTELNQSGATTLVAALIINDTMIIASAGDSQIFHIDDGSIKQLNEEDVLQTDDADNGALTKAIGYRESIEIETIRITLQAKDKILLCSDGLTRYLKDAQLAQLSNLRDPRDSVRNMINKANSSGGADNISAIVIHVGDAIEPGDIPAHIRQISVRVAVDTDPMMMQDVPSKPTTQIPLSRPQTSIDESLLGTPEIPQANQREAPGRQTTSPAQAVQQEDVASSSNGIIAIIVGAVIILVIGAIIFGIALASLGDDSAPQDNSGEIVVTQTANPETPFADD